jgi:3-oxoacyl-[acyl-carrier-protein] synthase II
MSRIPVTGIGVVAPGAIGVAAFRELLRSGTTAISPVERFDTTAMNAHTAGVVRGFTPKEFIPAMKLRRMNALSRFAVAAARLAIDDCGATLASDCGVAIGTAFGPVQTSVDYMQEYVEKGAALAPPQLFAESVANAPGSHIAIEWNLRGFNITVTQRESSLLAAAMYAATQILKGSASAALIGGVDEVNEMLFSVLDRVGALAHPAAGREEMARPFDEQRNGIVIGEGGAVFVAGGGARKPYGWLAGFGVARDTTASVSDWGTGHASVVAAMRAAIEDAAITPQDIDAIYASANGSVRGDALEAHALHALFGEALPPVVATKGVFGEYSAGGGLQLAAALLALEEQVLHASVGFESGVIAANRETRNAPLRYVLVNSLSAGGGIVSAVIARDEA